MGHRTLAGNERFRAGVQRSCSGHFRESKILRHSVRRTAIPVSARCPGLVSADSIFPAPRRAYAAGDRRREIRVESVTRRFRASPTEWRSPEICAGGVAGGQRLRSSPARPRVISRHRPGASNLSRCLTGKRCPDGGAAVQPKPLRPRPHLRRFYTQLVISLTQAAPIRDKLRV